MKNTNMFENVKTVRTTYRKLENFLYAMGISAVETGKEWDGSTYWVYEDTPQLRFLAESFKSIEAGLKQLNTHE